MGDIPDEWFENDIGPDPKIDEKWSKEFNDEIDAMIAENVEKAKRFPLGHNSDHPPEPPQRFER